MPKKRWWKDCEPCPFCGYWGEWLLIVGGCDGDELAVMCHEGKCFSTGPRARTPRKAVDKWNERKAPDA